MILNYITNKSFLFWIRIGQNLHHFGVLGKIWALLARKRYYGLYYRLTIGFRYFIQPLINLKYTTSQTSSSLSLAAPAPSLSGSPPSGTASQALHLACSSPPSLAGTGAAERFARRTPGVCWWRWGGRGQLDSRRLGASFEEGRADGRSKWF